MGEFADMAVDEALNGFWDDPDDEDGWGYIGSYRRRYSRRKIPTCSTCHMSHLYWEQDENGKWYLAEWNEEEGDYEPHVCRFKGFGRKSENPVRIRQYFNY